MTEFTPELLLRAYAIGVFPMAKDRTDRTLYWVDPEERGVLPLDAMHIPRRLRRTLRGHRFEVRCDTAFSRVVEMCAEAAPDRPDTWINAEISALYIALHEIGNAHSVETWRGGELVGGLYGVTLGSAFFGESMVSRENDASKVALVHLAARLAAGGFTLLDTQFLTEHLQVFGAYEVPRDDYRRMLADALSRQAVFQPELSGTALASFMQSSTQTS